MAFEILFSLMMGYAAYIFIRNDFVYEVRTRIRHKYGLEVAEQLPTYVEMMGFKYVLLWTTSHWLAWLHRQNAVQCAQPEEQ